MIDCPKCGQKARDFRTKEGVTMNFCSAGCKGVWFDGAELASYAETAENIPGLKSALPSGKKTTMHCPRCKTSSLVEVKYNENESVLVEVCDKCTGVFLDPGELGAVQKIADKQSRGVSQLVRAMAELHAQGYSTMVKSAKK